jgi:hypothetical protein
MASPARQGSGNPSEAVLRTAARALVSAARRVRSAVVVVLHSSEPGPGLPASVYFRHLAERTREFGEFGAPYDPAHGKPALKSGDDRSSRRA